MKRLDAREVGARIRAARQAANLTQSGLAERAGIEVQSLSRLERGEYEPSLSSAVALSESLGMTLDGLVLGSQDASVPAPTSLQQHSAWRAVAGARQELLKTLWMLEVAEQELHPRAKHTTPARGAKRRQRKSSSTPSDNPSQR